MKANLLWALLLVVVLAGCRGAEPVAEDNPEGPEVVAPSPSIEPPTIRESVFQLLYEGYGLRLGEQYADIEPRIAVPKNAFEFTELPPGLTPPFRARGWQSSREGLGVVTYNERVVLIMRQREQASPGDYEEARSFYTSEYPLIPAETVSGGKSQNTFLRKDGQTLMISATRSDAGLTLTVAIGQDEVMKIIGATPEAVQKGVESLDSMRPGPDAREPGETDRTPNSTTDSTRL